MRGIRSRKSRMERQAHRSHGYGGKRKAKGNVGDVRRSINYTHRDSSIRKGQMEGCEW